HQRASIETDVTLFDQPAAADGQQLRIAGAGTNEIHGHTFTLRATAMVTRSPRTLGTIRVFVPAASMAAGSATPAMPILARTASLGVGKSATRASSSVVKLCSGTWC